MNTRFLRIENFTKGLTVKDKETYIRRVHSDWFEARV